MASLPPVSKRTTRSLLGLPLQPSTGFPLLPSNKKRSDIGVAVGPRRHRPREGRTPNGRPRLPPSCDELPEAPPTPRGPGRLGGRRTSQKLPRGSLPGLERVPRNPPPAAEPPSRLASRAAPPALAPCSFSAFFKVSNPRARGVCPRCPCPCPPVPCLAFADPRARGALAPVPRLVFAGPAVAAAIGALGEEPISFDFISFQGRAREGGVCGRGD